MSTDAEISQEDLFKQFDRANFAVWVVDEQLQVQYSNPAARERLPQHCLADGVRIFLSPENAQRVEEAIAAGQGISLQPSMVDRYDIELSFAPVQCRAGRMAYVMLTPRIADESNQEGMQLRTALEGAGNLVITQGLRRCMSDIFGALASSSARLHGAGIDLVDTQLQVINRNCYQIMRATDNLADQIRYGAALTATLHSVDMWESCAQLLDACSTLLRASQLSFSYTLPDTTVFVRCDFDKITAAFLNLLSNCYLYGGKQVHVTVTGRDMGGGILLTVADDGPGIPPQVQDKLFQPFCSWDCLDKENAGTGLGLHLVRKIVTEADGRVTVNTGAGGTTVAISLPCTQEPPPPAQLNSTSLSYLQDRFSPIYFGLCDVVTIPDP